MREAGAKERDRLDQIERIFRPGHQVCHRIVSLHMVRNLKDPFFRRRTNSATADETQQSQKSTESAEAESILRRVKGSSNAYPPLRSVADSLCLVLDNCGVWPPSCPVNPQYLQSF